MKKPFTEQLQSIESLIQRNEFEEALSQLSGIDAVQLKGIDYALYCLLISETKLWLGDYKITKELDEAIRFYRKSKNNELYARAKYLKGWYLTSVGKHFEAREVLMESYLNYKRYDSLDNVSRVLNRLALAQFQTGAVDDAIANLERCVEINEKLNRSDNVQTLLRNIAVVHLRSGSFNAALRLFESVENDIDRSSENNRYQFYLTYAFARALKGDITTALRLISRTTEFSVEFKREKAHYYEYLGWIHILDGKYSKAERILKTGIKHSLKVAPESALISQTKRLLADAYIEQKKFALAEKTAAEALAVAEKISERAEIGACYRVFARVAQNRGNRSEARQLYKKAADLFSMINSRYELAVTRYLEAVSGLYDNGERAALLYLAREYFRSEEIRHYIGKTDDELAGLRRLEIRVPPVSANVPVFIAVDKRMKEIVRLAENVAQSDMTIFLTGPTGSGKDQLALYIHSCSGRRGKFVTVNCAAIPGSMVEAELFGYMKGAFTDAHQTRVGLIEEADGGTFYLNEISDATPEFQAKLLEVIETKTIRRLGGNRKKSVDIRIIAASNRDLKRRLHDGTFRLDLYHRLNELPIALLPLSARPDDTRALFFHFLSRCGFDFDRDADSRSIDHICDLLAQRDWPGNVRELRAEVNRMYLLSRGDIRKMCELAKTGKLTEREMLVETLEETDWNRSATARILGISEGTVRNKIKKYNLTSKTNS